MSPLFRQISTSSSLFSPQSRRDWAAIVAVISPNFDHQLAIFAAVSTTNLGVIVAVVSSNFGQQLAVPPWFRGHLGVIVSPDFGGQFRVISPNFGRDFAVITAGSLVFVVIVAISPILDRNFAVNWSLFHELLAGISRL